MTEASVAIGRAAGLPCIIQIASTDLSTAVQLAKHAEAQGAAAISATAPVFFSYSAADVWAYYQKLASAVHIPVMVYYNPAAKFPMDAPFGKRLFEIDNVTSIKWTSSDFYQMMLLKELTNGEMDIINGCDEMLLMGLCAGADGGIGTTYNYQLPYVKGVYDSFLAGDLKQAMAYQKKVALLVSASFRQEPIIPAAKAILSCMGYDVGHATFPMKRYTAEEKQAIYAAVRPYLP